MYKRSLETCFLIFYKWKATSTQNRWTLREDKALTFWEMRAQGAYCRNVRQDACQTPETCQDMKRCASTIALEKTSYSHLNYFYYDLLIIL